MGKNLTDLHNRVLWLETRTTEQGTVLGELEAKADYLFLRLNVLEGIDDAQSSEGTLRQLKMVFAGEEGDDEEDTEAVCEALEELTGETADLSARIENIERARALDARWRRTPAWRPFEGGRSQPSPAVQNDSPTVPEFNYECLQRMNEVLQVKNEQLLAKVEGLTSKASALQKENTAFRKSQDTLMRREDELEWVVEEEHREHEAAMDCNERLSARIAVLYGALNDCRSFLRSTTGHTWTTTMSVVDAALKNNGEEKSSE